MADQDPLAQSLSEEESEIVRLAPAPVVESGKKKGSSSPTRKQAQGYKFSGDKLTSSDFDFATLKKNGQANNSSNSSSEEGEDQEGFEVLNPEVELNGGDQRGKSEPPTTPSKLTTPHKRTAELVETGNDAITGANGSPPSSPAPKKRKAFAEYVAEEDAKLALKDNKGTTTTTTHVRTLGSWSVIAVVVVFLGVGMAYFISKDWNSSSDLGQTQGLKQSPKPQYTWKCAHNAFITSINKMKKQFPKQNNETWIQLMASIGSTLEMAEPKGPAAITVLLPPSLSDDFAECFVDRVGVALNDAVFPILQGLNKATPSVVPPYRLDAKTFGGSTTMTTIRARIEGYLNDSGKAILAFDVDKLKTETDLMLFHGLCDTYLAVDKRATTLFPVRVPQHVFEKYKWVHARGGDISTDVLIEAFQKVVSADTGPALVARIADGVILLNEGDQC